MDVPSRFKVATAPRLGPRQNTHMDDPTAWLGDPIVSHDDGPSSVYINLPPATRDAVVISVLHGPSPFEEVQPGADPELHSAYIKVSLAGALNLQQGLAAAIAQLQEHGDSLSE